MLMFTIMLTAGTVGATVVSDHVHQIQRPRLHLFFLYVVMAAVLVALVGAESRGALG